MKRIGLLSRSALYFLEHVNGDRNRGMKPRVDGPVRHHPDIGRNPERRPGSRSSSRDGGQHRNRDRASARDAKRRNRKPSNKHRGGKSGRRD